MNKLLLNRAYEIETWAEDRWLDSNGVVYSFIDKKNAAPLTDEFFGSDQNPFRVQGYTPAEQHNYENCGMTTGAYLQALLCRYAIEKNEKVLEHARRCVHALKYIYDLGRELEEGFFPKIYGNRFTDQTSTDQVLYAVMALDHFCQYAKPSEKSEIDRMITSMVNFWVKRDYRYKYFAIENMLWPLDRFPSLLLLAFNHSGDSAFKREYDRLLASGVNKHPGGERLRPKIDGECPAIPYEEKMQAWLISNLADSVTMDVMELDYLLRNDPNNSWSDVWKQSMRQIWEEGKLTLAPDGTMYVNMLVDMKTHQARRPDPDFICSEEEAGSWKWVGHRYIAGARTGWSTMIARGGVQAYGHLRDPEMLSIINHILTSIDQTGLTYYDDPERFLPELRHKTQFYSGDAMANWLWAYWKARYDGIL
ncbi:MAG: hypothetical protein ACYC54_03400 [Sedimentisphaerales bacterium]